MSGDYSGAPGLTFLSKDDDGVVAPGNTFRASLSPRYMALL